MHMREFFHALEKAGLLDKTLSIAKASEIFMLSNSEDDDVLRRQHYLGRLQRCGSMLLAYSAVSQHYLCADSVLGRYCLSADLFPSLLLSFFTLVPTLLVAALLGANTALCQHYSVPTLVSAGTTPCQH